jgi:hypothetical protein
MHKINDLSTKEAQQTGQSIDLMANLYREELVRRIALAVPRDGGAEPIPGLYLHRASAAKGQGHGVASPCFCVIAHGIKEIQIGEERYQYDPYKYLLASVEMPIVSQIIEASPERPYLSLRLHLDPALVDSVLLEAAMPLPRSDSGSVRAIAVSPLDDNLLESAVRLVRLVDAPASEARVLLPLITREIVFRLLIGAQSARLRHIAILGGHTDRLDPRRTDARRFNRQPNPVREYVT